MSTVCKKCGFESQGKHVRPHNCRRRINHPEDYISPRPAAATDETIASKSGPGTLFPKGVRSLALADLDAMPPVALAPVNVDAQMGAQLTDQYHRATGGMVEVLKFGAMMMQLREGIVSARGHVRTGGAGAKDTGIKAWLEQHAPEINRQTAYRLEAVTQSIAEQYIEIVGAKVAKQFALPALVTTPSGDLPDAARAKQLELFDYVRGTSQRSWLDRFKAPVRKGGKTYDRTGGKGARGHLTAEEATQLLRDLCAQAGQALAAVHGQQAYITLTDAELDGLIDHCAEVQKDASAWRRLTKTQRTEAIGARITRQLEA